MNNYCTALALLPVSICSLEATRYNILSLTPVLTFLRVLFHLSRLTISSEEMGKKEKERVAKATHSVVLSLFPFSKLCPQLED